MLHLDCRALLLSACIGLVGCNARFTSLLPRDSNPSEDGSVPDDGGTDDGGATPFDAGELLPLAEGQWEGESGYRASGSVTLLVGDGDQGQLEFSDDFSVSRVPGPFVVVSTRSSLSGGVSPERGDRLLGPLQSEEGAQTYDISGDASSFEFAWVYCQPFTVEVARARLVRVP